MANQVKIEEIKVGDILSEGPHFRVVKKGKNSLILFHIELGAEVEIENAYVSQLMNSANQYSKEVTVGKEDKKWTKKKLEEAAKKGEDVSGYKEGDVQQEGIRTLFEKIYSKKAIALCFQKADVPLSAKKLKELQDAQIKEALERIQKVKDAKKGVAVEATKVLKEIQENPVLPYTPGEDRILIGWKEQFESRDGRYNCYDASIDEIRPVNITTLRWLVVDGVRYNVEK